MPKRPTTPNLTQQLRGPGWLIEEFSTRGTEPGPGLSVLLRVRDTSQALAVFARGETVLLELWTPAEGLARVVSRRFHYETREGALIEVLLATEGAVYTLPPTLTGVLEVPELCSACGGTRVLRDEEKPRPCPFCEPTEDLLLKLDSADMATVTEYLDDYRSACKRIYFASDTAQIQRGKPAAAVARNRVDSGDGPILPEGSSNEPGSLIAMALRDLVEYRSVLEEN